MKQTFIDLTFIVLLNIYSTVKEVGSLPLEVKVQEGQGAVLPCKFTNIPIHWHYIVDNSTAKLIISKYQGNSIQNYGNKYVRFNGVQSNILITKTVMSRDNGYYICNQGSAATAVVRLIVLVPLKKLSLSPSLRNTDVLSTQPLNVSCIAEPTLYDVDFSWKIVDESGTTLSEISSYSVKQPSLLTPHLNYAKSTLKNYYPPVSLDGQFILCSAWNEATSPRLIQKTGPINLLYPPNKVLLHGTSGEWTLNDTINISCSADNAKPIKGTTFLLICPGNAEHIVTLKTTIKYGFNTKGNATAFWKLRVTKSLMNVGCICIVTHRPTNSVIHSPPSVISVKFAPEVVHTSKRNVNVVIGGKFALKCEFMSHPRPGIQWTHNGNFMPPIKQMKRDNFMYNSTLTVDGVNRNHAGNYTCEADNGIGMKSNAVFSVKVTYDVSLSLTLAKDGFRGVEGKNSTLECMVINIDSLAHYSSLSFSRQCGEPITTDELVKITGALKIIRRVSLHRKYDGNKCTCSFRSKNRHLTDSAIFDVLYSPIIETSNRDSLIFVDKGSKINMSYQIWAKPEPHVIWNKDNKDITGAVTKKSNESPNRYISTLVIDGEVGNYKCTAKNKYGASLAAFFTVRIKELTSEVANISLVCSGNSPALKVLFSRRSLSARDIFFSFYPQLNYEKKREESMEINDKKFLIWKPNFELKPDTRYISIVTEVSLSGIRTQLAKTSCLALKEATVSTEPPVRPVKERVPWYYIVLAVIVAIVLIIVVIFIVSVVRLREQKKLHQLRMLERAEEKAAQESLEKSKVFGDFIEARLPEADGDEAFSLEPMKGAHMLFLFEDVIDDEGDEQMMVDQSFDSRDDVILTRRPSFDPAPIYAAVNKSYNQRTIDELAVHI